MDRRIGFHPSIGSVTYIPIIAIRETSNQEINDTFDEASHNELKNIHFYTKDPIESIDMNNSC